MMYNVTKNPANKNFQVLVDGTSNLTTTLNAWGFAAKGHYYELSEDPTARNAAPTIVDASGKPMVANKDDDDTLLGVEPLSGACLVAKERIFMNLAIYGDDLF